MAKYRFKRKAKYTHTGVRMSYMGVNDVLALRRTPHTWIDCTGIRYDNNGKQTALRKTEAMFELDLTTIRAIEDR